MGREMEEKGLENTIRRTTIFFLFAPIFTLSGHILTDIDMWWHLGAGKYMLENQYIPKADIFSYTTAGRPWIDLQWLFQILSFSIYGVVRVDGLIKKAIKEHKRALVYKYSYKKRKKEHIKIIAKEAK